MSTDSTPEPELKTEEVNTGKTKHTLQNIYNTRVCNDTRRRCGRECKNYPKLVMHLRFEITEITSIDTQNQRYGIKGAIRRIWCIRDGFRKLGSNRDAYEPQFQPKFHFLNSVETIHHDADRVVIKNNKYNQQVISFNMIFTEEFEIQNFPFDVQDLSLVLKEARNHREITQHVHLMSYLIIISCLIPHGLVLQIGQLLVLIYLSFQRSLYHVIKDRHMI